MSVNEADGEEVRPGVVVLGTEHKETVGRLGPELDGNGELLVGPPQHGEGDVTCAHELGVAHHNVCGRKEEGAIGIDVQFLINMQKYRVTLGGSWGGVWVGKL